MPLSREKEDQVRVWNKRLEELFEDQPDNIIQDPDIASIVGCNKRFVCEWRESRGIPNSRVRKRDSAKRELKKIVGNSDTTKYDVTYLSSRIGMGWKVTNELLKELGVESCPVERRSSGNWIDQMYANWLRPDGIDSVLDEIAA